VRSSADDQRRVSQRARGPQSDDVEPLITQVEHRPAPEPVLFRRVEQLDPDTSPLRGPDIIAVKSRSVPRRGTGPVANSRRSEPDTSDQRQREQRDDIPSNSARARAALGGRARSRRHVLD
jgi:hypothetical protein